MLKQLSSGLKDRSSTFSVRYQYRSSKPEKSLDNGEHCYSHMSGTTELVSMLESISKIYIHYSPERIFAPRDGRYKGEV